MKTASECFGENLKRLRIERDLTQAEFASRAGLSISFLQNLEKGKKWAGPKTISMISRALKVREPELFQDCASAPDPDPKYVLSLICKSLGFELSEEAIQSLKIRNPPSAYSVLYESMPDSICVELTELCQRPGWSWNRFHAKMKLVLRS